MYECLYRRDGAYTYAKHTRVYFERTNVYGQVSVCMYISLCVYFYNYVRVNGGLSTLRLDLITQTQTPQTLSKHPSSSSESHRVASVYTAHSTRGNSLKWTVVCAPLRLAVRARETRDRARNARDKTTSGFAPLRTNTHTGKQTCATPSWACIMPSHTHARRVHEPQPDDHLTWTCQHYVITRTLYTHTNSGRHKHILSAADRDDDLTHIYTCGNVKSDRFKIDNTRWIFIIFGMRFKYHPYEHEYYI